MLKCSRQPTPPFTSTQCSSQQDPSAFQEEGVTPKGFLKTFILFTFAAALCFPRCVCSNAKSHMTSTSLIVSPSASDFLVSLAA